MFCFSITFPEIVGFLALVNLVRKCDQRGLTLGFSLLQRPTNVMIVKTSSQIKARIVKSDNIPLKNG